MVNELGFKIIYNAVRIRMSRGEELENIIASYPKLSEEQRQQLIDIFSK